MQNTTSSWQKNAPQLEYISITESHKNHTYKKKLKTDGDSIGKPKVSRRGRFKKGNGSVVRVGTSEKGKAEFRAAEKIFVS